MEAPPAAKGRAEWRDATPTTIKLAVGAYEARVSPVGTLLVSPGTKCEPIIALHELIRLGYRMTFLSVDRMRIWKPGKPDLKLDCSTGCPEVDEETALQLINEIEVNKQVSQARAARLVTTQGPVTFEDALQELPNSGEMLATWFRTLIPSIPDCLMPELAVSSCTQAAPWNRRKRRALQRTRHIIVHLFAGESRDMFSEVPKGWMPLSIDVKEDLHDPNVFGFLLHLARQGQVKAVVGGPPCRTFSALRHKEGGPPPVRGQGEEQWGLRSLSPAQQAAVDRDSILFLKMFMLTSVARRANRLHRGFTSQQKPSGPEPFAFLIEQPEDPAEVFGNSVDDEGRFFPSCWRWSAWQEWSRKEKATTLSFDQGPLGHQCRKPTTVGMFGPGWSLQTSRGPGIQSPEMGQPTSASLAKWAPGLVQAIQAFVGYQMSILKEAQPSPPRSPRSLGQTSSDSEATHTCAAMTRTEKSQQEWAQHLAQDHLPRRRDCFHCLAGELPHRPHRRVHVPQAYCLGIDLIGKLQPAKHEPSGPKSAKIIRYGLVGVYTFPKVLAPEGSPAAIFLLNRRLPLLLRKLCMPMTV